METSPAHEPTTGPAMRAMIRHIHAHTPSFSTHYTGVFLNRHSESWVFQYDRQTHQGRLWGSDLDWEQGRPVRHGIAAGLLLDADEQAWLHACWRAATAWEPHP